MEELCFIASLPFVFTNYSLAVKQHPIHPSPKANQPNKQLLETLRKLKIFKILVIGKVLLPITYDS